MAAPFVNSMGFPLHRDLAVIYLSFLFESRRPCLDFWFLSHLGASFQSPG